MPEFLVCHLPAPMASWGGPAVGEVRPSDDRPTRSALLGLVGAALGVDREDHEGLSSLRDTLRFAVEVRSFGSDWLDYHTTAAVEPPKKGRRYASRADEIRRGRLHTVLSYRHYRCDAEYRFALWTVGKGARSLEEIEEALLRPKFALYLGRRACPPALPLLPVRARAETLREALEATAERHREAWESLGLKRKLGPHAESEEHYRVFWEGAATPSGFEIEKTHFRNDQPISRFHGTFDERPEHEATIHPT